MRAMLARSAPSLRSSRAQAAIRTIARQRLLEPSPLQRRACSTSTPVRVPPPRTGRPRAPRHRDDRCTRNGLRGNHYSNVVSHTRGVARYSNACHRASTLSRTAIAPYVPMRLSLRIANTRSRDRPARTASATSASPSSCRTPEISGPEHDRRQRGDGNRKCLRGQQVHARARRAEHRADQRKECRGPAWRRVAAAHRKDRQESYGSAKSHHLTVTLFARPARISSSKLRRRPPRSAGSFCPHDREIRAPVRSPARSRNPPHW